MIIIIIITIIIITIILIIIIIIIKGVIDTMRISVGRVIRVLKASVGADPRSGAGLRVYVFNKGLGLKLI
jgi:hypothetical protein